MAQDASYEAAFRQVIAHRTMLLAYVGAIVKDPELAEDTLSDLSIEIARCWGRYDPARPFAPWARGVARRVALSNLRKRGASPLLLDADVLDAVGSDLEAMGDEARLEARKQTLRECIGKLSEGSNRLVRLRYYENRAIQEIAGLVNRSVEALYMAFSRIHASLSECVKRRVRSA